MSGGQGSETFAGANREGPLVTVGSIRSSIVAHANTAGWLNYYLAEAERAEGITAGTIARPVAWQVPTEVLKWPESQMPCVLVVIAGTEGTPVEHGEGAVEAAWAVEMAAVVRGIDQDDTDRQASVYEAALRAFVAKQALRLPNLTVEGVRWNGSGHGEMPQQGEHARSLRMAGVNFTLSLAGVVSTRPGTLTVPASPLGDLGPYPAVGTVAVTARAMEEV